MTHMDIKDLDKKQLILLTLLITFVVSVATGIVTVSLMNQMPKSVPQTINNVIQRTIEKVTTVETPVKENTSPSKTQEQASVLGGGDVMVSIYPTDVNASNVATSQTNILGNESVNNTSATKELGQGIIISDVGLVLVDSSILNDSLVYKVILNKIDFDATILKKFTNGFTILKITEKKAVVNNPIETKNTNTSSTGN
jgi:hypothetical protein